MGRFRTRGWLLGALVVAAVAVVSASALVFQGRDDGGSPSSASSGVADPARSSSTTTSSSTSSATSTTSTTVAAAPQPPAPTTAPGSTTPPPAPAPPVTAAVAPPPPPPAPACDGGDGGVVAAMNADRASGGLAPLCGNSQLAAYAQSWASWMAQHQSLVHQDLGAILGGTSFGSVAENILDGPASMSVAEMEALWMASAPHHANIMNGSYVAAGVGIAYSADGRVWVAVDFGG